VEERGKNRMSIIRKLLIFTPFFLFLLFFYMMPLSFLIGNVNQKDLVNILLDDYIHRLFYGTLMQAVFSTLITLLLSLPLAFFLAKYSFKGKRILEYVLLTPFFVPAFTVAEGLIVLLGEKGIVNSLLSQIFATGKPVVKILYSMWAVILAHVIYYVPLATLILEQGFSSVDQDLVDAARVFSGSTLRVFKTVYLNFLTPHMVAASLLVFAFSFITYSTPMLVGGKFTTLEVEIYATRFKPVSSSIALLQLSSTLFLSIIIIFLREKYYAPSSVERHVEEPVSKLFSSFSGILLAAYVVFICVFELTPIVIPVVGPFLEAGHSVPLLFRELCDFKFGFGLSLSEIFLQSLSIALIVSVFSTLLSVAIVWSSKLAGGVLEKIVSILMVLPLTMSRSSLALGILLSYGFGIVKLYGSWMLMVIGQSAVVVPLATRIIEASWSRIVKEYREAADAHGATVVFRLIRVEIPLILPAVVATLLMAFSSSLSDFTFSTFFSTLNLMTIPVAINLLIDYRRLNLALALTSLLTSIVIIVETAGSQFSKERVRMI
jgi:thiamine transport system permease protein